MKNKVLTLGLTAGCIATIIPPLLTSCSCSQEQLEPQNRVFKCNSVTPRFDNQTDWNFVGIDYCFTLGGFHFNGFDTDKLSVSASLHIEVDLPPPNPSEEKGHIDVNFEGAIKDDGQSSTIELKAYSKNYDSSDGYAFGLMHASYGTYKFDDFAIKNGEEKIPLQNDDYSFELKPQFVDVPSFISQQISESSLSSPIIKFDIPSDVEAMTQPLLVMHWGICAVNTSLRDSIIFSPNTDDFCISLHLENQITGFELKHQDLDLAVISGYLFGTFDDQTATIHNTATPGSESKITMTIKWKKTGEKIFENNSSASINPWKVKLVNL